MAKKNARAILMFSEFFCSPANYFIARFLGMCLGYNMTLEEYLKDRDIREFAKAMDAHISSVYRWLNGDRKPTGKHLANISKVTKGKVTAQDFYK